MELVSNIFSCTSFLIGNVSPVFRSGTSNEQSAGSFSLRLDHQGRAALVFDDDDRVVHEVDRGIAYPRENKLRVFMVPGLIEAYLGDYLIDVFKLADRQFPHHALEKQWKKENKDKNAIRCFTLTNRLAPIKNGAAGRIDNMKAWR